LATRPDNTLVAGYEYVKRREVEKVRVGCMGVWDSSKWKMMIIHWEESAVRESVNKSVRYKR
jgi:hypothetical protein